MQLLEDARKNSEKTREALQEDNLKLKEKVEALLRQLEEARRQFQLEREEQNLKTRDLHRQMDSLTAEVKRLSVELTQERTKGLQQKDKVAALLRELEEKKKIRPVLSRKGLVAVELLSHRNVLRPQRSAVRIERRPQRRASSIQKARSILIPPAKRPTLSKTRTQRIYLKRETPSSPPKRATAQPQQVPKIVAPPRQQLTPGM